MTEVESLRTLLASRTHFEVLGLEAESPRKLLCSRLEDSTIFWTVEILHRARQRCGSRYDFPGVEHEGRQTCQLKFCWKTHKNVAENLQTPFLFFSLGA